MSDVPSALLIALRGSIASFGRVSSLSQLGVVAPFEAAYLAERTIISFRGDNRSQAIEVETMMKLIVKREIYIYIYVYEESGGEGKRGIKPPPTMCGRTQFRFRYKLRRVTAPNELFAIVSLIEPRRRYT